jgi:hypothetical protein
VDVSPRVDLAPGKSPVDMKHVIGADYNPATKKVTGGHSLLMGDVRVIEIKGKPDANGVYEAIVEIKTPTGEWKTKMIGSTNTPQANSMFPKDWDEARIHAEIDSAWSKREAVAGKQNMWKGKSNSGVEITGYIEPRTSAIPIYNMEKK